MRTPASSASAICRHDGPVTSAQGMRLGYSMWGFLGEGVLDTPDGSRAYRRPFLDGLLASGHEVVLLQANRDLTENGVDLGDHYCWDSGFPDLNGLIFEWRWPLPGRNTIVCGSPGHTCDLHRQRDLFDRYSRAGVPTLVWDLDRQLPVKDPLRRLPNVAVGELALNPTPGAHTLACPVPDALLDAADPSALAAADRATALVYVGNQYDRDDAFDRYFAPVAPAIRHRVAGKWPRTEAWPHINFTGRCPFPEAERIHGTALATVLLLPRRYAHVGHMTSRWFESILAGCVPLAPAEIHSVDTYVPRPLQVFGGQDVIEKVAWLRAVAGGPDHVDLISQCLKRLQPFRCSIQVTTALTILKGLS